ncbi:MAG: hypothetical protein ACI4VU_08010 [Methanobrevibacter sp.]
MKKRSKIIILILILIIGICLIYGVKLIYYEPLNSNYSKNLVDAINFQKDSISLKDQADGTNTEEIIEKLDYNLNSEKNSLENAKKYSKTNTEKKYIELEIGRVDIELQGMNTINKNYNNLSSISDEQEFQYYYNKYSNYTKEQSKKIDRNQKEVKELLDKNPDFKFKITHLNGIKGDGNIGKTGYLGDVNATRLANIL